MKRLRIASLAAAVMMLAATASWAQVVPYSQDFESLNQASGTALSDDGWLVFGLDPNGGYGPFPAPNGGPGFSGIDIGQGGVDQGAQQLVVYNDYNNPFHNSGQLVEANVFQEWTADASNLDETWVFSWQHKRGNIDAPSSALAFIKVLDPNNSFALTVFEQFDTSNLSTDWGGGSLQVDITPAMIPGGTGPSGHIVQIGFLTETTNFVDSGNFYDNINFDLAGSIPVPASNRTGMIVLAILLATGAAVLVGRRFV